MAEKLIDAAARAGADAIKFQTFKADRLATSRAPKAAYQRLATGGAETQLEMLRRLELPQESYAALRDRCRRKGLVFLSSPFDEESADFLVQLKIPLIKIPSGELTNLRFLAHVANSGRPVVLSTGMAAMAEVGRAVNAITSVGNLRVALLHCISNYPADPAEANLRAMDTMRAAFGVPVGFSDHTEGIEVALAAAALGASVIEKHFTLDKTLPGPDHRASLAAADLHGMVKAIRKVESSLGTGEKRPAKSEAAVAAAVRKSLVAARDIPAGAVLTENLITLKRPGTGLPPDMLPRIVGQRTRKGISAGTLFRLDLLQ